jgi:hypothetical protein
MRSEHRAPLVASIVVVLVCIGVMAHAVRTEAIGGFARHTPMGLIAGSMLYPTPAPPADAAPDAAEPPVVAQSGPPARSTAKQPSRPSAKQPASRPAKRQRSHPVIRPEAPAGIAAPPSIQVQPAVAIAPTSTVPATVVTAPKPTRPGHRHGHRSAHSTAPVPVLALGPERGDVPAAVLTAMREHGWNNHQDNGRHNGRHNHHQDNGRHNGRQDYGRQDYAVPDYGRADYGRQDFARQDFARQDNGSSDRRGGHRGWR